MITADIIHAVPLFSALPEHECETLADHVADVHLRAGDWLVHEGDPPQFNVVLEGTLSVFKMIGGRDQQVLTLEAGDYIGEVPLLLGANALGSIQATDTSRVMRLNATDFHDLVTACPALNAQIMRSMASRVGALQQLSVSSSLSNVTVTGPRLDPACHDVREFLLRNHVPFRWVEPGVPGTDGTGNGLHATAADDRGPWPTVSIANAPLLYSPTRRDLAEHVGLQTRPASLGFPSGVSGDELSLRARQQAVRFGAELLVARDISAIEAHPDGRFSVTLDGEESVRASAVILATGVAWRRLALPGADEFMNRGVYYGAALTEANGVRGKDVYLVGGGNSAGQAAMLFANFAERVTLLVRGPALAASMSRYLIDQLDSKSNIRIETQSEVVAVAGRDCLESITVSGRESGTSERRACAGLFIFTGAQPETTWIPTTIIRDQWDYVCTGRDVMDLMQQSSVTWPLERDPYLLETSAPGIFAVGDVRHGSIKRVAAGVGEGSMAIAFVHQHLAERARTLSS